MFKWLTSNVAESRRFYSILPSELREEVIRTIKKLDSWELPDDKRKIAVTRRTKIIGFIDDIEIVISPEGDGSLLDIKSASRVGIGDMGQNRRNIQEFFTALESELKS